MKKNEAIKLFGNCSEAARAIGVTRSAVSKWPDPLTRAIRDRVVAAALRKKIPLPDSFVDAG